MSEPIVIDLFAEDLAHQELLSPLVERVAQAEGKRVRLHVRSARGGHGVALTEFKRHQDALLKGMGGGVPDLVIAAIDANCSRVTAARQRVLRAVRPQFAGLCIPACPDPHIERWYLADLQAFHEVVGHTPSVPRAKCERDLYKQILAQAVVDAGHPATLGGIEFARELAEAMDFARAGRLARSLGRFVDELQGRLRLL
jgi:hypothetical protein